MPTSINNFINKNQNTNVIFGERLTPDNQSIITREDYQQSDRVRYRFSDSTIMIILISDLTDAKYKPLWEIRL